ncbi:hypothetical protein GTW51_07310 [Aurantimonas aggregata]|uniref:Uncharacterized protein n=1 Tax=Aurantimonas aggregata TaxID=2047720 RepID=A0A6L9MFS5_9HYPH|nr:hypothetical protein [Aurantimonas aggregata]NDV86506.1 hypothetical protein [Aurantimonas aggregata]
MNDDDDGCTDGASRLYLVIAEGGASLADLAGELDAFALAPTMLLVRTGETRSRLYHFVKRRVAPERLVVAGLDEAPKFKGFAPGALNWLRRDPAG